MKWAGSRDKIFSPSGRGKAFLLTSLFIELVEDYQRIDSQPYATFRIARAGGRAQAKVKIGWFGVGRGGREHFAVCIHHPRARLTLCFAALKLRGFSAYL